MKKYLFTGLILLIVLSGCTSEKNTYTEEEISKAYDMKEEFVLGDVTYIVHGADQTNALGSGYDSSTIFTEGMYYIVSLTVENKGDSAKKLYPTNHFVIVDDKGREYKPNMMNAVYAKTTGYEVFKSVETLQPGIPKYGAVVFEMPVETKGVLKVKPGWFSGEALVKFE